MTVTVLSLTPMLARLRVTVAGGGPVTARVVGPRREGYATVEVSYAMRLTSSDAAGATLEATIPEPNRAPYVYEVVVTRGAERLTQLVQLPGARQETSPGL